MDLFVLVRYDGLKYCVELTLCLAGVHLGSLSWSVDDVTNKQDEFTTQLHDTLTNKQSIVFKVYCQVYIIFCNYFFYL